MRFVIGVDGGGTKTLLKLADMDGNLLAACDGGPSNIYSTETDRVEKVLRDLIFCALEKVGAEMCECEAICLGMAGAGREEGVKILEGMAGRMGFTCKVIITSDVRTALYGGIGSEEGIIVIAGTGSICYGRNNAGESCRAGGWGHRIGDEGSGYAIGLKALQSIMRSFDGRERYTALTPAVLGSLKMSSPEELVSYVYRSDTGKKEISDIAKIVDQVCMSGDAVAVGIQKNAAYELYLCAKSVIEKLHLMNQPAEMAVGGSLLTKSKFIRDEFCSIMNKQYPLVGISDMKHDAAWGAVLIAFDQAIGKGRED